MRGVVKLAVLAAGLAVAAALLVVLYASSRYRANVSHCRNNLRHLGGLAARNWSILDPDQKGRAFWQDVRQTVFRSVKGEWGFPYADVRSPGIENPRDPFLCPVHGETLSLATSAQNIDYRGPRAVPDKLKDTTAPLGADRPGNHPSGGHVLWIDASVGEVPTVRRCARDDPGWKGALESLID